MINQFDFKKFQGDFLNHCYHEDITESSSKLTFYLVREQRKAETERGRDQDRDVFPL